MTLKTNDIWKIEKYWKENSKDSIERDSTISTSGDKPMPWYYLVSLSNNDSIQPLVVWIMENTPEELKSVGFSYEEIKNEIKWKDYRAK